MPTVASHESFQPVSRTVAVEVAVTHGAAGEPDQYGHPIVERGGRSEADSPLDRFDALTPLREVVKCPTIFPRWTRSIGVHRAERVVALSLRSVIVFAMSEAGR